MVSKEDGVEQMQVTNEEDRLHQSPTLETPMMDHGLNDFDSSDVTASDFDRLEPCFKFDGKYSGKVDEPEEESVEKRLKRIEECLKDMKTPLVSINSRLNYLVDVHDSEVPRGIRGLAKHMSPSWTCDGRSKRKHKVAELIRQLCKRQRLRKGAVEVVNPTALHDGSFE